MGDPEARRGGGVARTCRSGGPGAERLGPDPDPRDDATLLAACIAGDASAWTALLRRYRALVYSVPWKMGLQREDCDDVFQETFLALLEKLPSVRSRHRIAVWLAVTARRKALDRLIRGAARFETAMPAGHGPAAAGDLALDELLQLERQDEVRRALERLPGRCRTLLDALFYRDPPLAYGELASLLGVPEGSIGPTRKRCFERLRREVRRLRGDGAVFSPPARASDATRGRSGRGRRSS